MKHLNHTSKSVENYFTELLNIKYPMMLYLYTATEA